MRKVYEEKRERFSRSLVVESANNSSCRLPMPGGLEREEGWKERRGEAGRQKKDLLLGLLPLMTWQPFVTD